VTRIRWADVLIRAVDIVNSYDIAVTLRQLFYRLVMEELITNTDVCYKTLSARTAAARRASEFPRLFDRNRKILQPTHFAGPADAMDALIGQYRRDRTKNQDMSVFLGVEKNALSGLLQDWFHDYGLPVIPLGGYSSEGLDRDVKERVERAGRPAVLIYAGDFDASGMDIGRSFIQTTDCWKHTIRIGLSPTQIADLDLPVLKGKAGDTRAPKFIDRHPEIHQQHDFGLDKDGRRFPAQVELDAVDPGVLHGWFLDALAEFWDMAAYEAALAQENTDMSVLRELFARLGGEL
jgi:hypothetical protein